LKFASVCSGIEAASVAFEPLGFMPQWFSEIEPFPCEVLNHRFPTVPNLGDMTKLTTNETFQASSIDLLVGGTPCQSFSVAGLRGGLADPRGNLMLTFLALADAKKPRWILWENVYGVLSSNGGRDFGTFLGALGELGYGFAYRVLDAQHFGVAQRRRRVFVVGHLGDWRPAAAVLFESESLQRDTKPSRKKRQETTSDAQGGVGESGDVDAQPIAVHKVSPTITAKMQGSSGWAPYNETEHLVPVAQPFRKVRRAQSDTDFETWEEDEKANTLNCFDQGDVRSTNVVAQPIAYSFDSLASNSMKSSNPHSGCREVDVSKTIDTTTPEPSKNQGGIAIAQPIQICFNDANGTRKDRPNGGCYITENPQVSPTVTQAESDLKVIQSVAQPVHAFKVRGGCEGGGKGYLGQDESAFTLSTHQDQHIAQPIAVDERNIHLWSNENMKTVPSLTATDYKGAKSVAQPIAVDTYNQTVNDKTTQTIGSSASDANHVGAVLQPTIIDRAAFSQGKNAQYEPRIEQGQTMSTLVTQGPHAVASPQVFDWQSGGDARGLDLKDTAQLQRCQTPALLHTMAIRRLTPKECERLQGFPDDWTRIPYRNKPAEQCPDGPRYKACGNSMAVPVMRWIGQRIQLIDTIIN
jgi:DNA-cytosine methyltransferase